MDLNVLRSRLQGLQNPKGGGSGDGLKKTLWAPAIGKHSVRILPSAFDKSNPFKELYFHYEFGKTMISLVNFEEKDPVVEFAQKLRKSTQPDDWKLAKKLEPKMRVYVPVIVRGEEDRGPLLWSFGKQIYMELLSIANDEDVGDFTDAINGRDITIETLDKATTGKDYNTSTVRVRTKSTPISENADEVKRWLTEQPNPLEQFKRYSYEEIKSSLVGYLNPEDEKEEVIKEAAPTVVEPEKFTLNTSKKSIDSKIDDLFSI
jgi:hypothetical protein